MKKNVVSSIARNRQEKMEIQRTNEFALFLSYVCRVNDDVSELNVESGTRIQYSLVDGKIVKTTKPYIDRERIRKMAHPEDLEAILTICNQDNYMRMIDTLGEVTFDCRILTDCDEAEGNGEYHWYRCTVQGMARDERHPNCVILFRKDTDAIKRAEEEKKQQLREALDAAERANNAKSQFTSRMSHEIRTPLNAVIGYMRIGRENAADPAKVVDCMKKAEIAAKHLLSIINDVLDMSSIESGNLKIANESFDFRQLLSAITALFYSQGKEKDVAFTVLLEGVTEDRLIGDGLRLNQILMNLLSNAIKFTPSGGRVILKVLQEAIKEDRVFFRFLVQDTGIGIREEYRERLFKPYEQQDSTIAQLFGGSGLGLSITKNLVTMMNGVIDVESRQGGGTVFNVGISFGLDHTVHDKTANEYKTEKMNEAEEYDLADMHVLLAEDNSMNQEIAIAILEGAGVVVDCVVNGQEAVGKFESELPGTYQAILMDVQMPILNGYEATKKIRSSESPEAASIPIIAMTADAFTEDVSAALHAGMNDHVAKPIDIRQLFSVLVKYKK